MAESEVEELLAKGVKARGGEIRKVQWIGRRGAPDRRVMLPGCCMWVELKDEGKPLDDHQAREHKRMKDMGEHVVTLSGVFQVHVFLKTYDQERHG